MFIANPAEANSLVEKNKQVSTADRGRGILILAQDTHEQKRDPTLAKAWEYYNKGNYDEALKFFNLVLAVNENELEANRGLAYTLLKLERLDEALLIAEEFKDRHKDFTRIRHEVYFKKAQAAYEKKDYDNASLFFAKMYEEDKANSGARDMLAWSLYNKGSLKEALPLFVLMYNEMPDPQTADIILTIHDRMNNKKDAFLFSQSLRASDKEILKAVGGDYFFKQGFIILASQTLNRKESCYYNADKPSVEAGAYWRSKSGDKGLSRLSELSFPIYFHYPLKSGRQLTAGISHKRLSSGDARTGVFAGSFYNAPQKRQLLTSLWVDEPEIIYKKEGYINYTIQLGMTPIGGVVSPSPTFDIAVKSSIWKFDLHQSPVTESILSYTGLEDPYSDREWGRVLKTGAEAEVVIMPRQHYSLSLKAGYDSYRGENVLKNHAYHGTAAFGRSMPLKKGNVFAGAFISMEKFSKNTNFYTFGHGGYFSPQDFIAAGPMVHFQTLPCKTSLLDMRLSLSYLNYETDSTPHYPLSSVQGRYEGSSFHGLGYGMRLKWLKQLAGHWGIDVFLNADKSSGYSEWLMGMTLRYFFTPRSAVVYQD